MTLFLGFRGVYSLSQYFLNKSNEKNPLKEKYFKLSVYTSIILTLIYLQDEWSVYAFCSQLLRKSKTKWSLQIKYKLSYKTNKVQITDINWE